MSELEVLKKRFGEDTNLGVDRRMMTSKGIIECIEKFASINNVTKNITAKEFYWQVVNELTNYPYSDVIITPKEAVKTMKRYILL